MTAFSKDKVLPLELGNNIAELKGAGGEAKHIGLHYGAEQWWGS